jgi:hypothetical protein
MPSVPIKECGQKWNMFQDYGKRHFVQDAEGYLN